MILKQALIESGVVIHDLVKTDLEIEIENIESETGHSRQTIINAAINKLANISPAMEV